MYRYTVSPLCASSVFVNRPGMLYFNSEDIPQVRHWLISIIHLSSSFPQRGQWLVKLIIDGLGLSLITLFTPCHMFCQGNAFHQQGKQQWKTDHPLLKRRIITIRRYRTFVSEGLPHTIMMNLSGTLSRSAAPQFPMFMISPSFREGARRLPSFFCSSF